MELLEVLFDPQIWYHDFRPTRQRTTAAALRQRASDSGEDAAHQMIPFQSTSEFFSVRSTMALRFWARSAMVLRFSQVFAAERNLLGDCIARVCCSTPLRIAHFEKDSCR